jgi:hypothetical protein
VGGKNDGKTPLAIQLGQQVHDLASIVGVQITGRFVSENEIGSSYNRSRDGRALHLASRKLGGKMCRPPGKSDPHQHLLSPPARLSLRYSIEQKGERYVLTNGKSR